MKVGQIKTFSRGGNIAPPPRKSKGNNGSSKGNNGSSKGNNGSLKGNNGLRKEIINLERKS